MIGLRESKLGISFEVRVVPRSGRIGIRGLLGSGEKVALKIALHAAPIEGRANQELIEQVADLMDVPRAAVSVIAGAQSRSKVLRVQGRTLAEMENRITSALAACL